MRINYILPRSQANGPGHRYVVWVQGCSIHCPGCSNADTWDPQKGDEKPVNELASDPFCGEGDVDGVTITGGEPLDQYEETLALCKAIIKEKQNIGPVATSFSIFLTTGYTLEQMQEKGFMEILDYLDILCVGPYNKDVQCSGQWKGSSNQEIFFLTELGKKQSRMPVILTEYFVRPDGQTLKTGFTFNEQPIDGLMSLMTWPRFIEHPKLDVCYCEAAS